MTRAPERVAPRRAALLPLFALLLLPLAWSAAAGGAERHCLWAVRGEHNTVYLLGSVHMLSAADAALPRVMTDAYERSASLVMELDLNDPGVEAALGSAVESTLLPEEQSLRELLGPALYAQFLARAGPLGLQPEVAERLQPWFAALLLEQLTLASSGFAADAGVDMQLAHRAQADHKPVVALETVAEQLGYFAGLPLPQQVEFLRTTLAELDDEASQTAAVVRAWQRGDAAELERLMRAESAHSPELFRVLTTDRNRKWLPRIEALLHGGQDHLVVVGALHLVGSEGLVELLRRRGYGITQQ